MKYKKTICFAQMILLITFSFSYSYIIHEASKPFENVSVKFDKGESIIKTFLGIINRVLWNEKTFASALEPNDLIAGTWTCLKSKDGSLCQSYPASECNSKCDGECVPAEINNVEQCKLGTCYNMIEGTCALNAPKSLCVSQNQRWFDDQYGNIAECREGCCVIGGKSQLASQQQCSRQAVLLGTESIFRTDITNPVECRSLALEKVEGACLYGIDDEGKNKCKLTTNEECRTIHGNFYEKNLCSNPALNTSCEKQKTTACIFGKEEVYWIDSCGNRENIYSYPKAGSWNDGFLLDKQSSCSISSGNNLLQNSKNCGNCDYLLGSICRRANAGEVSVGDFVCGEISCVDENGEKRFNGESWCSYQGSVGLDVSRATDTVGSRSFRQTCVRGNVETEPCADFRNEICVEAKTKLSDDETFSTAACRLNRWQQCIAYNNEKGKEDLCNKNPDCFIKSVNVGSNFKFNVCVPKYPAGFILTDDGKGQGAETICGIASQTCTKVMVKGLGGWKCKSNCECDTAEFTKQMNDLCISLGDCGAKANYLGTFSDSYKVSGAPQLDESYKGTLMRYANEKEFLDKPATPENISLFLGSLGIPAGLGTPDAYPIDETQRTTSQISMPLTITSTLLSLMTMTKVGLSIVHSVSATLAPAIQGPLAVGQASLGYSASAGLQGFAGAIGGASLGLTVVTMLLQWTGVGRGLPPAVTYSLIAAGAIGGAMAGIGVAAHGGVFAGGLSQLAVVGSLAFIGLIIVVVVVIVIIIMALLGIGKVKKIDVSFQCKPWQAIVGGSECGKCGSDGKICSFYSCSSLGQTCQLINADTDKPECVNINPNDVSPPVIQPWTGIISPRHDYANVEMNGFKIKGPSGCVEPYTNLLFGLNLNEPGQCRMDITHTNSFNDMRNDFGTSSLFKTNHSMILPVPSLEALGYNGYAPNASAEYNLYIRCQDKNGNTNNAEYVIRFCIQREIDFTPPVLLYKEPLTNIVGFLENEQNVTFLVNEPAQCKWDNEDKSYEEMKRKISCETDIEDQTCKGALCGWKCNAVFPAVGNSSKSYIKCKDWPWISNRTVNVFTIKGANYSFSDGNVNYTQLLIAKGMSLGLIISQPIPLVYIEELNKNMTLLNETVITNIIDENGKNKTQSRNSNTESYILELSRTVNPLKIDSVSPDNQEIVFGVQPASVEIVAHTSGGLDGTAKCSYDYGNYTLDFLHTFGREHRQTLNALLPGNYDLKIICIDAVGNRAEKTARVNIKLDTKYPKATRVYMKGGTVYMITDEDAQCTYRNDGCNYDFVNGTLMFGTQKVHTFSADKGADYYIKCKDQFNNNPGSLCSAIVRRA